MRATVTTSARGEVIEHLEKLAPVAMPAATFSR